MKEVCRFLSVKQLVTMSYHPICNVLVEKFNGTLKTMLRHMCSENQRIGTDTLDHCCLLREKLDKRVWVTNHLSCCVEEL